jgi:hypothetical protein
MAQYMAGHADPRTTKLYDRRRQQVTRGEMERYGMSGKRKRRERSWANILDNGDDCMHRNE